MRTAFDIFLIIVDLMMAQLGAVALLNLGSDNRPLVVTFVALEAALFLSACEIILMVWFR